MIAAEPTANSTNQLGDARARQAAEFDAIVKTPLVTLCWDGLVTFVPKGALCWAAGWAIEWMLSKFVALPALGSTTQGPIAGAGLVLVVYAAMGLGYALMIGSILRLLKAGNVAVPGNGSPSVAVRPSWWARWIRDTAATAALCLIAGVIYILGQWALTGNAWFRSTDWAEAPKILVLVIPLSLVVGTVNLIHDGIAWLLRFIKPYVIASRTLWMLTAIATGLFSTPILFLPFLGVILLADPFAAALGLGSTKTIATGIALFALAARLALTYAKFIWEDRTEMLGSGASEPAWRPESFDDFRNWNLDVETSHDGIASNGFPYYVWRESADNRLGLSRPRYCCIEPRNGELSFVFFDPTKDVRASGGLAICIGVAVLVAVLEFGSYWLTPRPYVPYAFDERPPIVLVLLSIAFSAPLLGATVGGLWHTLATLFRWYRNRFEGDGRISFMPLATLTGFDKVHAGELGAKVNGEEAKSGHGLTAVFEDGSMMILTGNAWNYPSIVAKHRDFTNAFRAPRDKLVAEWNERHKKEKNPWPQGSSSTSAPAAVAPPSATQARIGVPESL